ncbi:hypothetical protein [Micromonospora sp. SH-82]|uniref:hypothetical protein n=1 Tax=Micromonospora sp. SH-82 TaxID=3132938 RepID=UPI003EC12E5F
MADSPTRDDGRSTPEQEWYERPEFREYGNLLEESNYRQFAAVYEALRNDKAGTRANPDLHNQMVMMKETYLEGREFHGAEMVLGELDKSRAKNSKDWDLTEQLEKLNLRAAPEQTMGQLPSLGDALAAPTMPPPRIHIDEAAPDQRDVSAVAASASPLPGGTGMLTPGWLASRVQGSGQPGHADPSSPSTPAKVDTQGGRSAKRAKTS